MAIPTFAAIDVGSSELSMKIFEVSKKNGIRELTHLRHTLLLGAETYNTGGISYPSIQELCHVLSDYNHIMEEFDVQGYSAYATSALREAKNNMVVLDQIKIQTGMKVKIISNSEQRFLRYKAIALKEPLFSQLIEDGTLIVDIGAGSVQISYFNEGHLIFTQNLKLGYARIQELFHSLETESFNYAELVNEYIEKDLNTLNNLYLRKSKIKNIIAIGDRIHYIEELLQKSNESSDTLFTPAEFNQLELPAKKRSLLLPTQLLLKRIVDMTKCKSIYCSRVNLCDSMVAEYAERKCKIIPGHDFNADILSAAINLAKKYHVEEAHINNVEYLALEIFDRIRKIHGMGKRERLLLHIAVILHSCGAYINMNDTRENSYKIIMSTEIIGLSHKERTIIANIVRYNSSHFPKYMELLDELDRDAYITANKLCMILRLANVLDKSNLQKIQKVTISIQDTDLIISADTMKDISVEKELFVSKSKDFEDVFGIHPLLRQRKRRS